MKKFLLLFLILGLGYALASTTGAGLIWGGELSEFLKTLIYIVIIIALVVGANSFMSLFTTSGALI
ncbi:hypothetical protein CUPS4244_07135 [Campylobacter upsaliensis]|uniref:hypothetical protein n=1 Tax=Campylobacter upsaliensis TaxID=28080 RepID=UPI00214A19D0|nr:hypothetical protein [Campylobacter upsaliensis]MCR2104850.1 hypothetical protein [Campylobacter upsaliensis]